MGWFSLPRWLKPDFTWRDPPRTQSFRLPSMPRPVHPLIRRFWGFVHYHLRSFSLVYCDWIGTEFDNQIAQLPFGLILKWSDGTRLEEVLTMQAMRTAGFPVPKVICYGDHPESPHAPMSILMTRVAGEELGRAYKTLSDEDKHSIAQELKEYLEIMRGWHNPWGENRICSFIGTAIRSIRIPMHLGGPFESEQELNEFLIKPSWPEGFSSRAKYEEADARARKMHQLSHPIVFSHGDLKHHNIMVKDGRITGFLDWEASGWYPDYWDYTTALRATRESFWWYGFMMELGARKYLVELDCDRALNNLTSASFYW